VGCGSRYRLFDEDGDDLGLWSICATTWPPEAKPLSMRSSRHGFHRRRLANKHDLVVP
jgi:hypothetical protein